MTEKITITFLRNNCGDCIFMQTDDFEYYCSLSGEYLIEGNGYKNTFDAEQGVHKDCVLYTGKLEACPQILEVDIERV